MNTIESVPVAPAGVFKALSSDDPSGDPAPSASDIQITRVLREAAKIIDVDLLDHVIIGDPKADPHGVGHYSFRGANLL